MEGYTLKQLKGFKFEVIKDIFDKAFKRVNTFVDYKIELVEDNDQEEAEMKKLIKVVPDEEEVVIDVIPLATKPPSIVDWKIVKEGKIGLFQIIRANGSSKRRHFKTLSLDELRSPDFNLLSDQEYSEEEVAEKMAKTMEQYMSKTRADYGSGVARPKIKDKDNFKLNGQFLKELRTNTFSGSDHEDANEHIEKVLEIVDLFHIPNITIDQVMLRAFPMSLTGAASHWLRNKPTGSIITWDGLKTKFLNKYCPPARTAKKMEEINNFQKEPDENIYQA
ncbi:retrovirus-related pol polyprotein from transposon TNT 1-94 [Tanacetum coccineum]